MDEILIFDEVIEEIGENDKELENTDSYYSGFLDSNVQNDNFDGLLREESDINVSDRKSYNFISSGVSSDNVSDDQVVSINSIIPEGTVINNYYSVYVSGNEVSSNVVSSDIMSKPISEYSVQESLSFFSICFALCVGLVILIKKGVFRWN